MVQPLPDRLATALADRYRLERELGAGGMATVYLAQDLKHDRKVAVKVLRPELAAVLGAERFVLEIRTTAALQHPNILPLFDSGSTDGFLYYVMPYVAGETLRSRLDREQMLGVEEAVRLTREVADALDHAHRHGVIHRDIKPENILVQDDRPLVADFGIALAVSAAADGRMTETGLSLGTPHYMSPEQATAEKQVTARSDIYSLGSVLYEMLTGEPPHTGGSAQQVIMKIVTEAVRPVGDLRKSVPPHVAAAVATALEKLPADRFESAKAFGAALQNAAFTSPAAGRKPAGVAALASRRVALPAALALTVLSMTVGAWGWLRPGRAATPVTRFPTTLGADGILDGLTFGIEVAISPDGGSLVYRNPLTGPGQLYVKRRGELAGQPLAGTEGGSGPFFSPDGAWIGFVADGQLRRIPSAGGASLRLLDSVKPTYNRGAWLEDGSIVYYDLDNRVLRLLPNGGASATVIASAEMLEGRFPWLPSPLPASRGVLFTAHRTECVGPVSCRPSQAYVYDARRDTVRAVFDDAVGAWYVPTGHVLFLTSAGTLMAARWDNSALAPEGPPVAVLDGIQAPGFLVSTEGTAYYVRGRPIFSPGPVPNATVVWVDRTGQVTPVDSSWQVNTGGGYTGLMETGWGLALSTDGQRLALTQLTDRGTDVWIKPMSSGPVTRLTLDDGVDRMPTWSLGGRAITFLSDRPTSADTSQASSRFTVWEQPVDGTSEPRLLWGRDNPAEAVRSPDGQWLVLGTATAPGSAKRGEILVVRPGVDSVARRILAPGSEAWGPALSPDGRWLAYVSNEPGTNEVFVRPFPDVNGGKWQVSSGGGSAPLWSQSGAELFYVADSMMQVVRIRPGPSFSAEPPRALFPIPGNVRSGALFGGTFAISRDDQRFLMVRDNTWQEMAGTPTLVVVQGFFDELRAKLKPR